MYILEIKYLVQVSLSVYVLLGIQLLLLPWELISYYARQSDKSRLRILTYTSVHIIFSALWSVKSLSANSILFDGLLVGTGILLAAYSFYFWNTEFQLNRAKHKSIILFSHCAFAFFGFLLSQSLLGDNFWGKFVCYLYIQVVVIFFVFHFVKQAFDQIDKAYPLRNAYVVASIALLAIPFMLFFIHSFTLTFLIINTGFLFITFTYIAGYVQEARMEANENKEQREMLFAFKEKFEQKDQVIAALSEELQSYKMKRTLEEVFNQYGLTTREKEVAALLLSGKSVQQIANMDGTTKVEVVTIRTHRMKIYRKTGIHGINKDVQFREKFLPYVQSVNS